MPEGEGEWMNYTAQQIIEDEQFTPIELGGSYGPTWSTHWFKVGNLRPIVLNLNSFLFTNQIDFTIPQKWNQKEARLR